MNELVLGGRVYLLFEVTGQEAANVIAAEAEGGLGEVIRAKGSKLDHRREGTGEQASAGELQHGADLVGKIHSAAVYGEGGWVGGLMDRREIRAWEWGLDGRVIDRMGQQMGGWVDVP